MKKIIYTIALSLLFLACENGPQLMPNVTGKAGEVLVVVDKIYLDGECGAALRMVLEKDYFALPQAEPMFHLITVSWPAYTKIFEPHRNQIKIRISQEYTEAKMIVQHDIAAAPQLIIIITGPDDTAAAKLIYDEQERLVELLEQAERNRILINAKKYPNINPYNEIKNRFGGSLTFPSGYRVTGLKTDKFIYVVQNSKRALQGILVFSYPYTNQKDFELDAMIAVGNEILKTNVPSSDEGSYMKIGDMVKPKLQFLRYNDIHFAEMRGLWEVEKGFMGGPFVSHSFLDKSGENIIVEMVFVYAPNDDKRNYIRQSEALLYSWEWAKESNEKQ